MSANFQKSNHKVEEETEPDTQIIFQVEDRQSRNGNSSEETSISQRPSSHARFDLREDLSTSEWSTSQTFKENGKRLLYKKGLYNPGSGEMCAKYISQSVSHVGVNLGSYPKVRDPGIKEALYGPEIPVNHNDDGQDLYVTICDEMNVCPVGLFYRGLLTSDINLTYYGVQCSGVRAMAAALQYNKHVEIFNLSDNLLDNDACYHLGWMLNSNTTIRELHLAGCRIGRSGLLRLGAYLKSNRSLTTLNLARNDFGEQGGVLFAEILAKKATVKCINLSNNKLGRKTAFMLTDVLLTTNLITHLDLSLNEFYHFPSTAIMLNSIAHGEILQELNLSWNALQGNRLAESIKKIMLIPTLQILDLSHNRFSGEAIPIIIHNLFKAKKLVTLDLSCNPLMPQDATIALKKMLRRRVKLQNLLMTSVCVDKEFLEVLDRVKQMRIRSNFVVTFDAVLENWTIIGPDARELALKRADYLGNLMEVDIAKFFLTLKHVSPIISEKALAEAAGLLDNDLIAELVEAFPGSKTGKERSMNSESVYKFMRRIWPERILELIKAAARAHTRGRRKTRRKKKGSVSAPKQLEEEIEEA